MAFGTVPLGTAARIYIGTTAPPSVLVGALISYSYPGDKTTEDTKFHNAYPAITSVDTPVRSVTLNCKYAKADSGQDIAKANFDLDAPTVIYTSALVDGTTGEYLPCICAHYEISSAGSGSLPDLTMTFVQQGAPVDVAGGL